MSLHRLKGIKKTKWDVNVQVDVMVDHRRPRISSQQDLFCVNQEDKKQKLSRLIGNNQVRDSQCKFVSDHYVGLALDADHSTLPNNLDEPLRTQQSELISQEIFYDH